MISTPPSPKVVFLPSLSLSRTLLRSFFIVGNKGSPDAKGELGRRPRTRELQGVAESEAEGIEAEGGGKRTKLGARADCSHELVMAEERETSLSLALKPQSLLIC